MSKIYTKYLEAKKEAKKQNCKTQPVYEIGPKGGKNFKGYKLVKK